LLCSLLQLSQTRFGLISFHFTVSTLILNPIRGRIHEDVEAVQITVPLLCVPRAQLIGPGTDRDISMHTVLFQMREDYTQSKAWDPETVNIVALKRRITSQIKLSDSNVRCKNLSALVDCYMLIANVYQQFSDQISLEGFSKSKNIGFM
jgi:hypothetical protein